MQAADQMERCGGPVAGCAKGTDLRADRRHCGSGNHVIAGTNRRGAQLGLSLLLASRCDSDAFRANALGVYRRGPLMAQVVAPRNCRQPGPNANHVWRQWRTPARGIRAGIARRLRKLPAGARR